MQKKTRLSLLARSALGILGIGWVSYLTSPANAHDLNKEQTQSADMVKLRMAAQPNDALAQLQLGTLYHVGNGVQQDDALALKWWQKSADQGNSVAEFLLGDAFSEGKGVSKNDKEAFKWWQKSADQGNADAQNNVGTAYHTGLGVAKDYSQAVRWWRKSAEQGGTDVEFSLGAAFYNGEGVGKDNVSAYMWFSIAVAQGSQTASTLLEQVGKSMNQSQITQAQILAKEWIKNHSKPS